MKTKDTKELIQDISNLRYEKYTNFWSEYLSNISILTKSPLLYILEYQNNDWKVCETLSYIDINNQEILQQAVSLSIKAQSNLYSYQICEINELRYYSMVSIKLKEYDDTQKYIVLFIENRNKIEFSNYILRALLSNDIAYSYFTSKNIPNHTTTSTNIEVLDIVYSIINHTTFKLACMSLVDELVTKYECNRVNIGYKDGYYIKPIAISHIENFINASHIISSLEAIFEESMLQNSDIYYPLDKDTKLIVNAHSIYTKDNNINYLYTFSIKIDNEIVGAISFESDSQFDTSKIEKIRLSINYVAPILHNIYKSDKSIITNIKDNVLNGIEKLSHPQNSSKKFLIGFVSVLLFILFFGKMDYKIEATTNIQTDNIAYLCAPYNGILKNVYKNEGDYVNKDEVIAEFDTQELSFKKLEILSDIAKYKTETDKAMASRELADMKVAISKHNQSQINLEKVNYFLENSKIKSPIDGVIVDGQKEKILNSPFSQGDTIIKIAQPINLYANIKVNEEDIDNIEYNQEATITLLSRPDEVFRVKIEKIIPMAKVDDTKGNIFVVRVTFVDEIQEWMRPGMSGVSKINTGKKSIIWILTHKITDYLNLYFW